MQLSNVNISNLQSSFIIVLKSFPQTPQIKDEIDELPARINNKSIIEDIILKICDIHSFKLNELSELIGKSEKYIFREFIKPLLDQRKITYKYPDMINHPDQAYVTLNKS